MERGWRGYNVRGIRNLKKNNDLNNDYEMEDGDDKTYYITKYSIVADLLTGELKFLS